MAAGCGDCVATLHACIQPIQWHLVSYAGRYGQRARPAVFPHQKCMRFGIGCELLHEEIHEKIPPFSAEMDRGAGGCKLEVGRNVEDARSAG